ncbi:MAG TPA: branched-chain amino acid ABC transporter permease [Hypericibacter adhaerens]|uniref:Branched-chain amino acid ABC transporter permease n=1 Tax=Hypericibacter adhaerens TaxID=2602016 RepID=A0A5J6N0U2_9PROT|nr:branched-chain amino acid ABC transporter permease [Hypericibacter adhaerens]QEX23449.1 branched-chain amino acid ABC transporter permease [Hypericibacter adhaerens]HWA43343.1 branched-chain amino acid ABC transporter permease [Hypericibacter adhaerens]
MNLLQSLIDASSLGAVYALAALGIGLTFSIMRLINFAHGELIMIGGYTLYLSASQPYLVMGLAAILVVTVLALGMERVAFRPLRRASPATLLIASFAVSFLLQHVAMMIFGARPVAIDFLSPLNQSLEIGSLRVPWLQLLALAVTLILLAGLSSFFRWTAIGIQMRAAAEDFTMARLVGIPANRVIAAAFAISGTLASIVSVYMVAQTGGASYKMGVNMVLFAFVASVIGGMGSLAGAALGGFLVGVVSVLLQTYLPEGMRLYRDAFVFGLFIAFLLWRPQGLLVKASDRERV